MDWKSEVQGFNTHWGNILLLDFSCFHTVKPLMSILALFPLSSSVWKKTARSRCIYVGSGDPVRVLHLLHTTNTLDTLEAFIAETYVQLVATKLCATLLAAGTQLFSAVVTLRMNRHTVLYGGLNSELV